MNFTEVFAFPQGAVYENAQYRVLASLNWIELFAHVFLDGPFSAINFLLVFRSAVLHPNLKFILLSQSACIFIRAIARSILNVYRLLSPKNIATIGPNILSLLYGQPTYVRNFIVHILVIERIMATVYFKRYERWRSWWFSFGWLLITSLVAFFSASARTFFGADMASLLSYCTFCITFVLSIFELVAFAWLWKYNDGIYQQNCFSLSEKYQLSENIRTAKQLLPCISLHFINILFGTAQSLISYYLLLGPKGVTNQFWYDLIGGQLVFTTSTIISFFIELSMILCHPFLKRDLLRWWQSVRRCHYSTHLISRNNTISDMASLEQKKSMLCDIHGKPLMTSLGDLSSETHFRHLATVWEGNNAAIKRN